jgi:hypothetical protein
MRSDIHDAASLSQGQKDQSVVRQEETSKQIPAATPLSPSEGSTAPVWARVPRGWIVLVLFVAAWAGVYLIWRGIELLSQH